MAFHVGMKVVCVDADGLKETKPLVVGSVYTIRYIYFDVQSPKRGCGFFLDEIVNALHPIGLEYGYYSDRFRPIVERKTDIGFAHEILRTVTHKNRRPAHA